MLAIRRFARPLLLLLLGATLTSCIIHPYHMHRHCGPRFYVPVARCR